MVENVMEEGLKDSDDELVLETFRPYKISFYQETANEAREGGNLERAREFYQMALEEIEEYRANIEEVREEATLSEEERQHLADMERDLDQLEVSLTRQLETVGVNWTPSVEES